MIILLTMLLTLLSPELAHSEDAAALARDKARFAELNQQLKALNDAVDREKTHNPQRVHLENEAPTEAEAAVTAWHNEHDVEYNQILQRITPPAPTNIDPPPVPKPGADNDHDGIPDLLEQQLLARFRPFYCFSSTQDQDDGGPYNPVPVGFYLSVAVVGETGVEGSHTILERAQLAADQTSLLKMNYKNYGFSDLTKNKKQTSYFVNPLANIPGQLEDPGRHGFDWARVKASGHIGLYGHVVPIRLKNPESYDSGHTPNNSDPGDIYYKIEYWQFFGYNSVRQVNNTGDHEGDWCSVQLLYSPTRDAAGDKYGGICSVFHYAHGFEMRFDMSAVSGQKQINLFDMREYLGPHAATDSDLHELGHISNNRVRFYPDPITRAYSHPVVYIEAGSHEFWPSQYWHFYQIAGNDVVPDHDGKGVCFLTATPPNLGEVEHPLTETIDAETVLKYNGYWGSFCRSLPGIIDAKPPVGPILHRSWTYPADSSIRWLLKNLPF